MLIKKPKDFDFFQYRIVNNCVVEYKQIMVHCFDTDTFYLSPYPPAYTLLAEWIYSDRGMWVDDNSFGDPFYEIIKYTDEWHDGHTSTYHIMAIFELKKLSEYYLKFGK